MLKSGGEQKHTDEEEPKVFQLPELCAFSLPTCIVIIHSDAYHILP